MATAYIRREGATVSPLQAAVRESSPDKTLIRRIAEDDQSAMRALFARYQVTLYRWLLRLVDDKSFAEDLLSEVFLDVWRQAASFEGRSSVSTWLLAIARYKALSARRRRTVSNWTRRPLCLTARTIPRSFYRRKTGLSVTPILASAIAGAPRGHRPILLPRQVRQGDCRNRWHPRGHGEDTHVLRAQEAGGVGHERVGPASRPSGLPAPQSFPWCLLGTQRVIGPTTLITGQAVVIRLFRCLYRAPLPRPPPEVRLACEIPRPVQGPQH